MVKSETWHDYYESESRKDTALSKKLRAIAHEFGKLNIQKINASTTLAYDKENDTILFSVTFGGPDRYTVSINPNEIIRRPPSMMERLVDHHVRSLFDEIVGEVLS